MNKIIFPSIKSVEMLKNPLKNLRSFQGTLHFSTDSGGNGEGEKKKETPRLDELRKKLREKTPIESLDKTADNSPKDSDFPPFPNNTNPETGEIGGPRGPEPTRYGDWERKGRVSDF
ncbi:succinate dehydrogenase assembly factor 4, mitochondrial-like [Lutzomyia longipalpis]|uniref:Succinate dehydrogenase assembly factor 4, mitochondrial n=1 Tax=Lutzomyia longipalpis TaxID=7200 RepID=A0A1B0CDI5_LUTLO|nr:succinate dehydrogenase assembly factor 4, mitochondrial-like [Lutzomyia longipalpis]